MCAISSQIMIIIGSPSRPSSSLLRTWLMSSMTSLIAGTVTMLASMRRSWRSCVCAGSAMTSHPSSDTRRFRRVSPRGVVEHWPSS
jgi:hypothetical protein